MPDIVDELISNVIAREGGYVNHPNDRGGPTKYGITQATLAAWRGKYVSAADVEALTEAEARRIYRERYFEGLEGIKSLALLELLFDYAVHAGVGGSKKGLQRVLKGRGLYDGQIDGAFGPRSKAALAKVGDDRELYFPLVAERLDSLLRICGRDPSQTQFAIGWANRVMPFWSGAV